MASSGCDSAAQDSNCGVRLIAHPLAKKSRAREPLTGLTYEGELLPTSCALDERHGVEVSGDRLGEPGGTALPI